jgi:alpha-L-rhamnosidase
LYYEDLAARIRKTFREKFFDAESFTVKGDCQTATGVMLYFGLYDGEREREGLLNTLLRQIREKDDHLDFGVLGNKFVMHSLGAMGYGSVGHKMLAQRTFPGVGEWLSRGATTLWECWNGGGSHNHHMFSDMSSFLYKYVAGIAPDENAPGFRRICFRPAVLCGMPSAAARHESMHGEVACAWENGEERRTLSLKIPFGCEGTVYLDDAYAETLYENGVPFGEVAKRVSPGVWYLPSGTYLFAAR